MNRLIDAITRALFIGLHVAAVLTPFYCELTWTSAALLMGLYFLRMFAITAGFHRYFSHRTFGTSRVFQFIIGFVGCMAAQRGPLWWAWNHREHHRCSDEECDPHSPIVKDGSGHYVGWSLAYWKAIVKKIWHSHIGWVLEDSRRDYDPKVIPDLIEYPELRLLDTFHWVPILMGAGMCYAIDGLSGLMYGYIVSTVLLYHATFTVNSVCHLWGKRPFATKDFSRNNLWVALLALGEGWHNNHHKFPASIRQGLRWWQIDVTYYVLWCLRLCKLVRDFKHPRALRKLRMPTLSIPRPPVGS